jgi:hypothetical protein
MVWSGLAPRGVGYAHDAALKAYDDQMKWIDALDGKAGILIAADGVIAGLIMIRESVLGRAPALLAIGVATLLLTSLVLAILAFSTRAYEIAPDIDSLLPQMSLLDDLSLKSIALKGFVTALDINESKVERKAALLFYSAITLLGAITLFGSYFVYSLV